MKVKVVISGGGGKILLKMFFSYLCNAFLHHIFNFTVTM